MTDWPKNDNETDIECSSLEPLLQAVHEAYDLHLKDYGDKISWNGPSLPKLIASMCLEFDKTLTREYFEETGKSPIEVILGIAVDIGMEHGRRTLESSFEMQTLRLQASISSNMLNKIKQKYDL